MKLPPGVPRYLLIGQVIIPFFVNIVVNTVLGVLAFRDRDAVMTWSFDKGAVADSIGTCFFLPFITCLIATPIVRRQVAQGVVSPIPAADLPLWMRYLSGPMLLRALKVGASGIVLLAGPVYGVYGLCAGESIETVRFIVIKAISAGVFGIFVTPLIAVLALADQTKSRPFSPEIGDRLA
ncbi:MAG TPA: hypothetical protein PLY87_10620 [Planctomycetaceae bacterium]|nr:hypothetical protein [Planctomycetaceae bacterium]HQZ65521.1 hypothetical protein [Planctomycetaceae bacterium]